MSKTNGMNTQEIMQVKASANTEEGISIQQLLLLIKVNIKAVVLCIGTCLCLSLVLYFMLSPRYEALTTIQVGKLIPINGDAKLIEDSSQVVERLKLKEFIDDVLTQLKLPTENNVNERTDLLKSSIKATAVKGSDFINITLQDFSRSDAEAALKVIVGRLVKQHIEIELPFKLKIDNDLKETRQRLAQSELEYTRLDAQLTKAGTYSAKSAFALSVVATNLLIAKQGEVRQLRAAVNVYQTQLQLFDEQATKIINKIQVTNRPVFPRKSIFLVIGMLFGILLSIGYLLYKQLK